MEKAASSRESAMVSRVARSVLGFVPNFRSSKEFTEYLRFTVIPDLRSSGSTETAADFAQAVRIIDTKRSPGSFPAYLKTLVRDLRASRLLATADDFDEAIYWMTDGMEGKTAARTETAAILSAPKRFELLRAAAKNANSRAADLAAWMLMDRDEQDAAERRTALKAMEEVGTHLNRATMALTDAERSGYFD